jgi:hypothetical protein
MNPSAPDRAGRPSTNLISFFIGLPLAALLLLLIHGPLRHTPLQRYVQHEVECVEVAMFCIALGGLLAKLWQSMREQAVLRTDVLPRWDGQPVPVSDAARLLPILDDLPARLKRTYLVRRFASVLDFLVQRRSAGELDDQLRALADGDSLDLEGSYAMTRFITWAIPILGFIGTVLGITRAIAAVTPEDLEKNLGAVTGGLALAFDATALGLSLTMVVMFVTFLVERREQQCLEGVDRAVERHLAHRFVRTTLDSAPFVAIVEHSTQALVDATGKLVQRQADLWGKALTDLEKRAGDTHAKVGAAVEAALERTLAAHGQRLAGLEKMAVDQAAKLFEQMAAMAGAIRDTAREQQIALARTAEAVSGQAAELGRLVEGEKKLAQIQAALQQNLAALQGAGAFEQAVHTLTAAIHLLTARTAAQPGVLPMPTRPGKAA